MTNGLFVGKAFLENIKCMKWKSQYEKRCNFVGAKNQEYILMQNNVEFKTIFQIHRHKNTLPQTSLYYGMHYTIERKRLVMLIDRKIEMRTWKNEGAMGRNGEKVIPTGWSYSTELFELQNFTLKFLSLKPYNV
jgi:hypothetical protein